MATGTITKIGGGATPGTAGFTDSFKIGINVADTNAGQTDNQTMAIKLAQADTNAGQLEALSLSFPSPDFGDSSTVPSETKNFLARFWLTGSAGAGVTNPANADGSNNGTFATLQTQTAGAASIILTSDLGANVPTVNVAGPVQLKLYFKSINTLVTSTGSVTVHSKTALFADVVIFTNSALNTSFDYTVTPLIIQVTGNSLARLQSFQIIHTTTDAVAGVGSHVMTVDAACLEFTNAFN